MLRISFKILQTSFHFCFNLRRINTRLKHLQERKLGGALFNASRDDHFLSFCSSAWLFNTCNANVALRWLLVLCTTSLLPSQPKLVLIYTPGSIGASQNKVCCSRTWHAGPNRVLTHDPEIFESKALPLSHMSHLKAAVNVEVKLKSKHKLMAKVHISFFLAFESPSSINVILHVGLLLPQSVLP